MERNNTLSLTRLGIDTYNDAVIFIRKDCPVCLSEGFEVHARVHVSLNKKSILATLYMIDGDLLDNGQASLSNYAWQLLGANEGDKVHLSHPKPLQSLSFVRSKIYGHHLTEAEIENIVTDIAEGRYSGIHIATFLTACAGGKLTNIEIISLTKAMVNIGKTLSWQKPIVVDKHCVGGLPGNRTTLIVVPIVAAFGLTMPKTSSRSITSPAGTADAMEALAPVDLSLSKVKQVVKEHGGCIAWGGAVELSPADESLIQVERAIDLDSEGQLIASVLSKKIAAGSTHILIDIPVGPTAKVRSWQRANRMKALFEEVGQALGLHLTILTTDGAQPIGRGIGPALEAQDVLDILQNKPNQPQDLRDKALTIAAHIIEFSPDVQSGQGMAIAKQLLESGQAWQKFQAICKAQGGMKTLTTAEYQHTITAPHRGRVTNIDNRGIARLAKLAGAPHDLTAGVMLHTPLATLVEKGEPLFTIHSESKGELEYAISLLTQIPEIIQVEASE